MAEKIIWTFLQTPLNAKEAAFFYRVIEPPWKTPPAVLYFCILNKEDFVWIWN